MSPLVLLFLAVINFVAYLFNKEQINLLNGYFLLVLANIELARVQILTAIRDFGLANQKRDNA